MKNFSGRALFLDRSDINTDEIIPARYLTEVSKTALKPYLLEDLMLERFDPKVDLDNKKVIITRDNFGCGSSREHAAWALEVNGINLVIAESFARIFKQNMFNCGMLAVEMPVKTIDYLFSMRGNGCIVIKTDFVKSVFLVKIKNQKEELDFSISGFNRALINAGGWVEYADLNY